MIETYFKEEIENLDLNYFINVLSTFSTDTLIFLLKPYYQHRNIVFLNEYLSLNISQETLQSLLSIEVIYISRKN